MYQATRIALRSFLPFWLFLVFYKFALTLHYTLIPILGERILPIWLVGIFFSAESFIQLMFDVPAGHLVDRIGQLRILKIATPIFFISAALLLLPLSIATFAASIVFSVFGWLFLGPGVNAYILAHARKESSGRFISLRDTFFAAGVVLASVALPFVIVLRQEYMALTLLAIALLGIAFLYFSPPDKEREEGSRPLHEEHPHHVRRKFFRDTLPALRALNPASGMLALHMFSGAIFYGTIWFVLPLVMATQLYDGSLSLGLAVFDFSIVMLGFIIGSIVDRGDKRLLVFAGLFIFAVSAVLCGLDLGILFILFGFLATAGDETTALSLWSWLHSLDKEHAHDGAVSGTLSLAEDLGYMIGPLCAGFLYGIVGPTWAIVCGAVPIVITLGIYWFFVYTRHHTHEPTPVCDIRRPSRHCHGRRTI